MTDHYDETAERIDDECLDGSFFDIGQCAAILRKAFPDPADYIDDGLAGTQAERGAMMRERFPEPPAAQDARELRDAITGKDVE